MPTLTLWDSLMERMEEFDVKKKRKSGFSKSKLGKTRGSKYKKGLYGRVSHGKFARKEINRVWRDDISGHPNYNYATRLVAKFVDQPLNNLLKKLDEDKSQSGKDFKEACLSSLVQNNRVTLLDGQYHLNICCGLGSYPMPKGEIFMDDMGYIRKQK